MKELVLYYSLGGSTRKYAENLAMRRGAEVQEITETKKRSKLTAFIPGCPMAIKGASSQIVKISKELSDYDEITLCSPVWASHCVPAVNAAIAQLPPGKKVELHLISSGGGGNPDRTRTAIEARGCTVIGVEYYKAP